MNAMVRPLPTGPPPPVGPPPPPPNPQRRNTLIIVGIGAILALVAVFVFTGKDDDDDSTTGTGSTSAEIFLEPATAVGADPFTASVDTNTAPPPVRLTPTATTVSASTTTTLPATTVPPTSVPTSAAPATTAQPATATTVAPVQGIRSVDAAAPGLYGGTRNNAACDREQMIAYLTNTPEKAAAWAGAQGITVAAIPDFIRSLTPMVLRADTRVTNFGFRNGVANPKQAVLQMGTAVLVDEYGVPRARCSCGNPLAPPTAQPAGTRWVGDPWPGFDPTTVIVVVNVTNVVVNEFVIVDLNGGYLVRPSSKTAPTTDVADGEILVDWVCDLYPDAPECQEPVVVETTLPEPVLGTGDIQFTLRWTTTADLDLAVVDPLGEVISYSSPLSTTGGQLDVDSNSSCSAAVGNPVENVFWPVGQSPPGDYTIIVSYYAECGSGTGPQAYTLDVLIDGVPVEVRAGFLRQTSGTVNQPGDQVRSTVTKPDFTPGATPTTTVAPTVPPTAAPNTSLPASPGTVAPPTPGGPTTTTPPETLEQYCTRMYPVPGHWMDWTLCMHDPTVA